MTNYNLFFGILLLCIDINHIILLSIYHSGIDSFIYSCNILWICTFMFSSISFLIKSKYIQETRDSEINTRLQYCFMLCLTIGLVSLFFSCVIIIRSNVFIINFPIIINVIYSVIIIISMIIVILINILIWFFKPFSSSNSCKIDNTINARLSPSVNGEIC